MTTMSRNADLKGYGASDSIFVRNNTKTDFNFRVADNQGGVNIVVIPRTFIPLDLTSWAPINQLKESRELRAAIRGNVLSLVPEDEAQRIIETEAGRIEYERIMSKFNIVTDDLLASDNIDSSSLDVAAIGDMDEINDQVRDAFADKSLSSQDRLALIISLDKEDPPLNKQDFDFILSVADSSQSELIKYANNRLKQFNGLLTR